MTRLGNNQYQLEETSICGLFRYRDTLETYPPSEDGSVRYRRMIKRSGLTTHSFVLSNDVIESDEMSQLMQRVESQGGHCETVAGGIFFAHVPNDLNINVGDELKQIRLRPK